MKRHEFEHAIRAAGAILGINELLVIGSQAIHASIENIFPEAERSIEVDVSALEDPDGSKADLIDGSIGELSLFQESYGYYAQGVTPQTAILPEDWRERLIPFSTPATNGITALCLEPHDLWISKAIANRKKDIEFCKALYRLELIQPNVLEERLQSVEQINSKVREHVQRFIESL